MEVILKKKPKSPTIIEGFPGFGLIGTIATEFLIDHLKTEQIGKIMMDELPPMVAIHDSKVVEPMGIFYSKKYNLVILHVISPVTGIEWKLSKALAQLAKMLKAKEIISIEGVGSVNAGTTDPRTFYYANAQKNVKKFSKIGIEPLKEGIIMGVTGTVLVSMGNMPLSCIFAETHSELPDSKAAARVIQALDKYLGLKVDSKPLLKQAEVFESKIKGILSKSKESKELQDKKKLSYVG